jgi:hypothetical protein
MMQTCYTARVHDGTITDLAGYMRECARAFMFEYRDKLDWNDPIPEQPIVRLEVLADAEKRQREAMDAIYALEGMDDEACAAAALSDFEEMVSSADRLNEKSYVEHSRLRNMAEQVSAWSAPAPLAKLKEFMAEQLVTSGLMDTPYVWPKPDAPLSAAEWRANQREHLQRELERAVDAVAKQRLNLQNETLWLRTLRAELGDDLKASGGSDV